MILEGGISYTQNWDKNGNIYYTDENGQVVDFKVNPFVKLANKVKATAYNAHDWLENTNPNSEAYKQKVGTVLGLATAPLGLGATLTGGIAKGLIPYVGRKIAQNMAQGIGSGVVGGAIGGGAEAGLNDRNIAIRGLQGATVGGLLGGLGGYGLGKVAQKLNTQTAWHGSPYKFDRFSNESIGTGEGAQAHGYGHYVAKNKNVAQGYADRLGGYEYNGKPITSNSEEDLLLNEILNEGYNNTLTKYQKDFDDMQEIAKNWEHSPNDYNAAKEIADKLASKIDTIKNIDTTKIKRSNSNLYKLSIPKDDVMLREDLPFSEQPLLVQKGLRDYFKQNPLQKHERRFFEDIENPDLLETITGGNLYRQIARNVLRPDKNMKQREANAIATQILQDKGIKGISYNDGIDGEANVIFNPDDIDIIPYYDNPTSFKEKFINLLNR